jgi:GNAT superfamily N-acetyltransferase
MMLRLLVLLVGILLVPGAALAASSDTAFVHVNVVPMDRERVLLDQTVIVSGERIVAIGSGIMVPRNARVIDGGGRLWLSPGLADMHTHSDTQDDLAVYLSSGITTLLNMGNARASFVGITAPAAIAGRIPGPHIYNAFVVDGSPEYGHLTVTTPAEGRAAVRIARTNGYRFIKVYVGLKPDVFAAVADEARRQGLPVVGHGVTSVGLRRQIALGQVLVAHAKEMFYTFFSRPGEPQTDAPPPRALIAEAVAWAKRNGVAITADLATYGAIKRQIGHPEVVARLLADPQIAYVSPADRLDWKRSRYATKTADLSQRYDFLAAMLKAMADAGVELLAGTDAPTIPGVAAGPSLHDDLAALEAAGFTRYQAL